MRRCWHELDLTAQSFHLRQWSYLGLLVNLVPYTLIHRKTNKSFSVKIRRKVTPIPANLAFIFVIADATVSVYSWLSISWPPSWRQPVVRANVDNRGARLVISSYDSDPHEGILKEKLSSLANGSNLLDRCTAIYRPLHINKSIHWKGLKMETYKIINTNICLS